MITYLGEPGWGKTALGCVASLNWAVRDERYGFGMPIKHTLNKLDDVFLEYQESFLYLDDTRGFTNKNGERGQTLLDLTMSHHMGEVKKRQTDDADKPTTYLTVTCLTANKSMVEELGMDADKADAAYFDRNPELPAPANCSSFFEDHHGFDSHHSYCVALIRLALKNAGTIIDATLSRYFALNNDERAELSAHLIACRDYFQRKNHNPLFVRVTRHFALVYASLKLLEWLEITNFPKNHDYWAVKMCLEDVIALRLSWKNNRAYNFSKTLADYYHANKLTFVSIGANKKLTKARFEALDFEAIIMQDNHEKPELLLNDEQFKSIFREAIEKKGVGSLQIKKSLAKDGLLLAINENGRMRYNHKRYVYTGGESQRFLVISIQALNALTEAN